MSATAAGHTAAAPATSGASEEPVAGGSLTYLNFTDTNGFDPAIGQTNSQFAVQNYAVYDVLAHESPSTGEVVFGLLESADSTDAVTWTLQLKPDLQFSDGTPLDAEAVKFNWERLADPATGAVAMADAQSISSMRAIDGTTLEVVLAEPNGQFVTTIATSSLTWIASPTAIQADPESLNTNPVGAGPYLLTEHVPGSHASFERNPNYHGTTYVDEFTVRIVSDEAQRLAALQSGDGDVAIGGSAVMANQASDAGFDAFTTSPNGGYMMFFNTQRAPFDDVRVRRAFALAFDAQELNDTVFEGYRTVATNLFHDTSPFYDERFDQPEGDAAAAQQLFDEIAAERGGPLEVTLSYIEIFTREAQWFQAKIAGFDNVTVNLEVTPTAEFQAKWSQGDVQFGLFAWVMIDPVSLTKYLGTGGPLNFSQTSDPEIDAALAAGAATLDEQERIEIYSTVQQMIVDEVPVEFTLRQETETFFDGDRVHGIGPDSYVNSSGLLKVTAVWVTE